MVRPSIAHTFLTLLLLLLPFLLAPLLLVLLTLAGGTWHGMAVPRYIGLCLIEIHPDCFSRDIHVNNLNSCQSPHPPTTSRFHSRAAHRKASPQRAEHMHAYMACVSAPHRTPEPESIGRNNNVLHYFPKKKRQKKRFLVKGVGRGWLAGTEAAGDINVHGFILCLK